MSRILTTVLTLVTMLFATAPSYADIRLASVFSDNMVIQRGEPIRVFGWGDAGLPVEVHLQDQKVTTQINEEGYWIATLKPIDVGEPFEIKIVGDHNSVTLKNCVAGEVWICSGQSNMEWPVRAAANPKEEAAAANYPLIRHIDIKNKINIDPQKDVESDGWTVCSPETVSSYSAVGYYFARHLHQELDVPVGLINSTWGGTIVEAWTSRESLKSHPDFEARIKQIEGFSAEEKGKAAQRAQAVKRWNRDFQKAIGDETDQWQATDLDDSTWKEISAPGHWEGQGFANVDGVMWYRKTVTLPEGWNGEDATLKLAMIDDIDHTFVNGQLVGSNQQWNAKRVYNVPGSLLKPGSQVSIAIRVADGNLGGGIHGDAKEMTLEHPSATAIPLAGKWKVKLSTPTAKLGPRPRMKGFAGPNNPTALYNAMINGLVPYTFKGAIWYQGESNAGRAHQYRSLFPLLINDWRQKWNKEFPFYWVQLANFMKPNDQPMQSAWAELREAQSMTLSLAQTGEAVIIDIGDANDIHPINKQDVGKRLALCALARDYGKSVVFSGPRYKSMTVEGAKAVLHFEHTGSGLIARDGPLKRFSVAGEDKKFYWAKAEIVDNKVHVFANEVSNPVAVRYAWANNPDGCNLYNQEGLPASPFRTDDWPGVTINAK